MHTSLAGAPGHDHYAPCSVADLAASGVDYWALGHIHKRSIVQDRCAIVMPGMPQGRDIGESGAKSVTLATIADDRSIRLEERITSVAQFETIPVDLSGIEDWRDMVTMLSNMIQRTRENVLSEHMVARLRFTGSTSLAWRLRSDHDLLREEAANRASVTGKSWIEKVEIECRAPGPTTNPVADPMTELRRLIDEEIVHSGAYQAEISGILDELRSQLPPGMPPYCSDPMKSISTRRPRAFARRVPEDVLALLHAKTATEET